MRIVQSLVVSDLSLGCAIPCFRVVEGAADWHDSITGTIGVSMALSDKGLHPGRACDGLGTMVVATIWSGKCTESIKAMGSSSDPVCYRTHVDSLPGICNVHDLDLRECSARLEWLEKLTPARSPYIL